MKELREKYKQETGREPLGNDYRDWLEFKNIALQERVEELEGCLNTIKYRMISQINGFERINEREIIELIDKSLLNKKQ